MTTDIPPLRPALPLNVIELILANVPLVEPGATPVASLLSVVSPRLVSEALASVIVDCYSPDSRFSDYISAALKRLFSDPKWNEYSKFVLGSLRRALEKDVCCCTDEILREIAEAGNLSLLIHVSEMHLADFDLAQYDIILASAFTEGHVNILEWWTTKGYALDALSHDHVMVAAQEGHLSVLQWWSDLSPSFHADFDHSDLFRMLALKGRISIMRWWKERFGVERLEFESWHWAKASENGHCEVLDFAKANRVAFPESAIDCIDGAAASGHMHVLDWWYHLATKTNANCTFDYSVKAMDNASANGHVKVLDFFAKSGLELRFTPAALQLARENGHEIVVEWWIECRLLRNLLAGSLPLGALHRPPGDFVMLCAFGQTDLLTDEVCTTQIPSVFEQGIEAACRFGQLEVLKTLHQFIVTASRRFGARCVGHAVENNQPAALQWCLKHLPQPTSPLPLPLDRAVPVAVRRGYIQVLDVLYGAGLLKANANHITTACCSGMVSSLDFLCFIMPVNTWDRFHCQSAWRAAAAHGHTAVFEWLLKKGVDCGERNARCIDSASANGHFLVLEWWNRSELPFKFTELALWDAVRNKHKRVIEWWIQSGRVPGMYILKMLQRAYDELKEQE